MNSKNISRRSFIKSSSVLSSGFVLGASAISAKSYASIVGANNRLNFAVIGVRSRGMEHIKSIITCGNSTVSHICDVDTRYAKKAAETVKKIYGTAPAEEKDIRILLENKDVDVITIATPEHWHAPMTLLGLQAGKHVYVEKPPSHNPAEGVMLVKAQKKYGLHVQMGNQQRSSKITQEAIRKIHDGVIGTAYFGKAWYSNKRKGIGVGKEAPVPDYLDWELWQGPAPRKAYKDNIHPYNWHWFWHWGTGETLNNGTHEVDLCLWALNAGFPKKVSATGGRYHFKDDWQFYDTLLTSFEYGDKMITWEGKSCNSKRYYDRGRGVAIHGTKGTLVMDRNGYEIYNLDNEQVFGYFNSQRDEGLGLQGGGPMTDNHFQNLADAIRKNKKLRSPIVEGNVSVTMLLLSNIAWKKNRVLNLDTTNGKIIGDNDAMKMWSRDYEPGWEPKI